MLTVSMSAMGSTSVSIHLLFIVWTIVFLRLLFEFHGLPFDAHQNTRSKIRGFVTFATAILIFEI